MTPDIIVVDSSDANGVALKYNEKYNLFTTFGKIIGVTVNGTFVVDGAFVYQLKATYGLPLSVSLDRIINEDGFMISWSDFIDEARKNKIWDFQTIDEIEYSLIDAGIPKKIQKQILDRCKIYIMKTISNEL